MKPSHPLIGRVIDQYEVVELLATGGMGVILKGRQRLIGREVAIKLLPASLACDQLNIQRLKREARALAQLNHPNIVTTYDFGFTDSAEPYLVMALLKGINLGDMLKADVLLPQMRAVRIFQQVAEAMRFAHDRGILHRDLKPDNIVISAEPDFDHATLLDFGIARLDSSADLQKLTRAGEVVGSPVYMAPEQCTGGTVDERSDIYSFGVAMFETLTGLHSHRGPTILDMVYSKIRSEPPRLRDAIPDYQFEPKLDELVYRCLQTNPDDRFESMADLSNQLKIIYRMMESARSEWAGSTSQHDYMRSSGEASSLIAAREFSDKRRVRRGPPAKTMVKTEEILSSNSGVSSRASENSPQQSLNTGRETSTESDNSDLSDMSWSPLNSPDSDMNFPEMENAKEPESAVDESPVGSVDKLFVEQTLKEEPEEERTIIGSSGKPMIAGEVYIDDKRTDKDESESSIPEVKSKLERIKADTGLAARLAGSVADSRGAAQLPVEHALLSSDNESGAGPAEEISTSSSSGNRPRRSRGNGSDAGSSAATRLMARESPFPGAETRSGSRLPMVFVIVAVAGFLIGLTGMILVQGRSGSEPRPELTDSIKDTERTTKIRLTDDSDEKSDDNSAVSDNLPERSGSRSDKTDRSTASSAVSDPASTSSQDSRLEDSKVDGPGSENIEKQESGLSIAEENVAAEEEPVAKKKPVRAKPRKTVRKAPESGSPEQPRPRRAYSTWQSHYGR